MDIIVTEDDSLCQNKLAFQIKSSLNQLCVVVREFLCNLFHVIYLGAPCVLWLGG